MTYQEFKNYILTKDENWNEQWNPVVVLQCATIIAICDMATDDNTRDAIWERYRGMIEDYFKFTEEDTKGM